MAVLCFGGEPSNRNVPAGIAFSMAMIVSLATYVATYKFTMELERMLRVASLAMATVGFVLMVHGWFR